MGRDWPFCRAGVQCSLASWGVLEGWRYSEEVPALSKSLAVVNTPIGLCVVHCCKPLVYIHP